MAAENDEDEGRTASPNQVESRPPAMTPAPDPKDAAVETNFQDEAESSSTSGDGDGGKPSGDAPEKRPHRP